MKSQETETVRMTQDDNKIENEIFCELELSLSYSFILYRETHTTGKWHEDNSLQR